MRADMEYKRTCNGVKKKEIQRGMGVAQLERLRLRELSKKLINGDSLMDLGVVGMDATCYLENQKKQSFNVEKMGCSGVHMRSKTGGCGFLDLSLGLYNGKIMSHESACNVVNAMDYSFRQDRQPELQIMAVHREKIAGADDEKMVEYDFFPTKKSDRLINSNDEPVMMKSKDRSSSSFVPDSSSTSVDLSLKLSY